MIIEPIINSAEALQVWRESVGDPRAWPNPIPAGCNTFTMRFRTVDGEPALLLRQSGFRRRHGEGEVNGMSVLIAPDAPDEASGYAALDQVVAAILGDAQP